MPLIVSIENLEAAIDKMNELDDAGYEALGIQFENEQPVIYQMLAQLSDEIDDDIVSELFDNVLIVWQSFLQIVPDIPLISEAFINELYENRNKKHGEIIQALGIMDEEALASKIQELNSKLSEINDVNDEEKFEKLMENNDYKLIFNMLVSNDTVSEQDVLNEFVNQSLSDSINSRNDHIGDDIVNTIFYQMEFIILCFDRKINPPKSDLHII